MKYLKHLTITLLLVGSVTAAADCEIFYVWENGKIKMCQKCGSTTYCN